jgi:hypothetical protein
VTARRLVQDEHLVADQHFERDGLARFGGQRARRSGRGLKTDLSSAWLDRRTSSGPRR